jgi:membrane protease YdiL (CAAX protease family)
VSTRAVASSGRAAASRARTLATAAVVPAGLAFLVARPFVDAAPADRMLLFGAGAVLVAAASIADPVDGTVDHTPRLPRAAVLTLGIAAVAAAALAAGAPPPAPWGPATLPLALLAAVAEEALFRRAAYARLLRFGALAAVVGSALLFAAVHLPAYGVAAFPVDLGAGLLLSWQRWASGTWTVPAATHAFANALAVLR